MKTFADGLWLGIIVGISLLFIVAIITISIDKTIKEKRMIEKGYATYQNGELIYIDKNVEYVLKGDQK